MRVLWNKDVLQQVQAATFRPSTAIYCHLCPSSKIISKSLPRPAFKAFIKANSLAAASLAMYIQLAWTRCLSKEKNHGILRWWNSRGDYYSPSKIYQNYIRFACSTNLETIWNLLRITKCTHIPNIQHMDKKNRQFHLFVAEGNSTRCNG